MSPTRQNSAVSSKLAKNGDCADEPREPVMTKAQLTNTTSALSGSSTNALRDIKPPVEIPSGWAWVGWMAGALALAAIAYWAWRYWQKKKLEIPIVPPVPPHVRAKQK